MGNYGLFNTKEEQEYDRKWENQRVIRRRVNEKYIEMNERGFDILLGWDEWKNLTTSEQFENAEGTLQELLRIEREDGDAWGI
jgi:hypothetical protein